MLGQDDTDMGHTEQHPRSYSSKPIWARMCVVSAGVIMNMIFAVVLFVICFMWGIQSVPPIIGSVYPDSVAAVTLPQEAELLQITTPGLLPGDRITRINDKEITEFAQIQMSSALARPGASLRVVVDRQGQTLTFDLEPRADATELRAIGVGGTSTNAFFDFNDKTRPMVEDAMARAGLANIDIAPGLVLSHVDGQEIQALWQLSRAIDMSNGRTLDLTFTHPTTGREQHETLTTEPDLMLAQVVHDEDWYSIEHLFGLVPASVVYAMTPDEEKRGAIQIGDVIVQIGEQRWPRRDQFRAVLANSPGQTLEMIVDRNGQRFPTTVRVNARGVIKFSIAGQGADAAIVADTIEPDDLRTTDSTRAMRSPAHALRLMPGTRITRVNGQPAQSWRNVHMALRNALLDHTFTDAAPVVSISIEYALPLRDHPIESVVWNLSSDDAAAIEALGWHSQLATGIFAPLEITIRASNPIEAVQMGMQRTWDMIVLTYQTLDHLVRGSVKVNQLKGPVGIAQIGTIVAGRGLMQLLMFLGIINVNLAVLNFLPIPIVDGGLMVFLLIEKLKGSPVSVRVQNAATLVGLALLCTVFLITFYNDVLNLVYSMTG